MILCFRSMHMNDTRTIDTDTTDTQLQDFHFRLSKVNTRFIKLVIADANYIRLIECTQKDKETTVLIHKNKNSVLIDHMKL